MDNNRLLYPCAEDNDHKTNFHVAPQGLPHHHTITIPHYHTSFCHTIPKYSREHLIAYKYKKGKVHNKGVSRAQNMPEDYAVP